MAVHLELYTKLEMQCVFQHLVVESDKSVSIYCRMKAICCNMCLLKDHIHKWLPEFKDSMQQFFDSLRPYQAEYASLLTVLQKQIS
jgi:hypothetical protein